MQYADLVYMHGNMAPLVQRGTKDCPKMALQHHAACMVTLLPAAPDQRPAGRHSNPTCLGHGHTRPSAPEATTNDPRTGPFRTNDPRPGPFRTPSNINVKRKIVTIQNRTKLCSCRVQKHLTKNRSKLNDRNGYCNNTITLR